MSFTQLAAWVGLLIGTILMFGGVIAPLLNATVDVLVIAGITVLALTVWGFCKLVVQILDKLY